MSDPVERLPLTALRVFEAAARLGSFKDAAVELGVSTTTVSNLIRKLEHDWGCLLFIRRTRHVVLTDTGLSLSGVVRNAFDAIGREINMHVAASRQSVAIAVGPIFGARWLAPRLRRFNAAFQHIILTLLGGGFRIEVERLEDSSDTDPADFRQRIDPACQPSGQSRNGPNGK